MTAPTTPKATVTTLRNHAAQAAAHTTTAIDVLRDLAEAVLADHDDHHTGPRMWCPHTACRKADEVLS